MRDARIARTPKRNRRLRSRQTILAQRASFRSMGGRSREYAVPFRIKRIQQRVSAIAPPIRPSGDIAYALALSARPPDQSRLSQGAILESSAIRRREGIVLRRMGRASAHKRLFAHLGNRRLLPISDHAPRRSGPRYYQQ